MSLRQLRRSRRLVALVVLLSVLSGPVAVAAGHCPGMASTCEGPCLLPSFVLPTAAVVAAEPLAGYMTSCLPERPASFVPTIPERPPKPPLIPA